MNGIQQQKKRERERSSASSFSWDRSNGHNWNNIDTNVTKIKSFNWRHSLFKMTIQPPSISSSSSSSSFCATLSWSPSLLIHYGDLSISPDVIYSFFFSLLIRSSSLLFHSLLAWKSVQLRPLEPKPTLPPPHHFPFSLFISLVFFHFQFHYSINGSCTGALPQSEVFLLPPPPPPPPPEVTEDPARERLHKKKINK